MGAILPSFSEPSSPISQARRTGTALANGPELTSGAPGRRLSGGMSLFAASPTVRRLAATTALAAIVALALGFCICEMPMPRATHATEVADECHESVEAPAQPSAAGAWSSDCCCSGDPQLPPGTLEARAPEAKRGASLLADASAFATRTPVFDLASLTSAPAWLVAASPPHAPPPAFVLPLRV